MNVDERVKNSTILLVDDNPANLGVLFDYLARFDFTILVAQDGEHAISLIEEKIPDLVLLDVMMPPGIDGFEVCRRLKTLDNVRDIPVIFMTALAETVDKVKGFEAGGVDYITKPFQHEEVLSRVVAHLTIRKLQQAFKVQNDQLQELNASKDKFFSIIAHDLRSPFNSLLGLTELMMQNADEWSQDKIKDIAGKLYSSGKNVYALLGNLLTWSRLQRGLMEQYPIPLDLQAMFARNLNLFTINAEQKQIILDNTVTAPLLVYADHDMVDTVIRNLLSNALKFTDIGGRITISATQNEDAVTVSVRDTGIGIPEEKLHKIFRIDERYQRLGTAKEKGTGLGLILCKDLIEKNEGTMQIESDIKKGTTCIFTLPIPR